MVSARRLSPAFAVLAPLATLAIVSSILSLPLAAQQNRTLALVGGQLLDGYEAPPIHHATVLIEGNRIVAVGPASEIEIPPNAEIINTAGKTMMPGMIDAHIHLMILGHGDYNDWFPWFEGHDDLVYETSAKQLLAAGVTSGVDLSAPMSILAFRDRVNANEIPGPRLLVSGPWVTRYAWDFLPDELRVVHTSPEEARERAQMLIDAGVDVIKTWIGTTGRPVNRASTPTPALNGPSSPERLRVPSGNMIRAQPLLSVLAAPLIRLSPLSLAIKPVM